MLLLKGSANKVAYRFVSGQGHQKFVVICGRGLTNLPGKQTYLNR